MPVKQLGGGEELIAVDGPLAVPWAYVLPAKQRIRPSSITALFDGSGAGGDFLPCCSVYSQDGKLVGRVFPSVVSKGDVAEVTYFPFAPPASAGGTPPPPGSGQPVYVQGTYDKFILTEPNLLAYWRMNDATPTTVFKDTSGIVPEDDLSLVRANNFVWNDRLDPIGKDAVLVEGSYDPNPANASNGLGALWQQLVGGKIPTNPAAFTFMLWVYWFGDGPFNNIVPELNYGPIVSSYVDGGNGTGNGWMLAVDLDHSDYGNLILVGGTSPRYNPDFLLQAGGLPSDTWVHIAVVFTGTQLLLYRNGVIAGAVNASLAGNSFFRRLGGEQMSDAGGIGPYWRNFAGNIGEVSVHGAALSATEILIASQSNGTARYVDAGQVVGSDIAAGTIGTAQLADHAVTTPKLALLAVTDAQVAAANKDGAVGTPSMRTLGRGAQQAAPGTSSINDHAVQVVVAASPVNIDASVCGWAQVVVNTAAALTVSAPTNPPNAGRSQVLIVEFVNNSGGAMGAITWNAIFKVWGGAFATPAAGKSRIIAFVWNNANWIEQYRSTADY